MVKKQSAPKAKFLYQFPGIFQPAVEDGGEIGPLPNPHSGTLNPRGRVYSRGDSTAHMAAVPHECGHRLRVLP